ncbi:MAG: type II toxin-antitoxin system RelE/ParE family toxin [Gemmatimonadetes bacterium]|nr:type II toxin-antitoxin system RelE/ParE family toxin [Candidatus Palauibacter australiensis]
MGYNPSSVEYTVVKSGTFRRWLKSLRDRRALARIVVRIERVVEGNFGDHRSVGGGVGELRIDVGGGYRIYYTIRNNAVVILLCGGDKSSQQRDIERARRMAGEL